MKFGNEHFDFYEGFIPFIYARYPGHGWITFQSFVTPFILWAGGFAVLVGIGSFVKGDKDSE
jgi:hypothetical protein